jgi:heme oxygenase
LKNHTSLDHERLDDAVGGFSDLETYRAFVAKSFAFRGAVERTTQAYQDWFPLALVSALRKDVEDLNGGFIDFPTLDPASSWSANLGRLYVLEGSSVGARMLYQRAQKLGFSDKHGARHLAIQADDVFRWRQFVALLDMAKDVDIDEALSGAKQLFEFAFSAYSKN